MLASSGLRDRVGSVNCVLFLRDFCGGMDGKRPSVGDGLSYVPM